MLVESAMKNTTAYTKIINYFKEKPVHKIMVFGSYALNKQKPSSDIDVLLSLDHPVGLLALSGYRIELEKLLGIKVDLGTENGVSSYVMPYIKKDAVVIYEK